MNLTKGMQEFLRILQKGHFDLQTMFQNEQLDFNFLSTKEAQNLCDDFFYNRIFFNMLDNFNEYNGTWKELENGNFYKKYFIEKGYVNEHTFFVKAPVRKFMYLLKDNAEVFGEAVAVSSINRYNTIIENFVDDNIGEEGIRGEIERLLLRNEEDFPYGEYLENPTLGWFLGHLQT
jgi:hypothetical protein